MIGFSQQIDVRGAPHVVFELLGDMNDLDLWNPSVSSSRRTQGDRWELGSRYESTVVRGPIEMSAKSTLVAIESGRTVRYEGSIGPFWSVDTLNFRPSRLGTQITFHNQTGTPPWMRPFHPLLHALFQRQAKRAVNGALDYVATHPEDPELA